VRKLLLQIRGQLAVEAIGDNADSSQLPLDFLDPLKRLVLASLHREDIIPEITQESSCLLDNG
jgi:hypothetical protein